MAARDVETVAARAADRLGAKVQARRAELRLTQEQLHDLTGISRNQIQNIEHSRNNRRGPGNARLDTVFKLAAALDVSPAYLIDPERSVGDY